MSWQSTVMPDDAPELAGSLVGTMLQGDTGNSKPSPNQRQIRSSVEDVLNDELLPARLMPLWKVMGHAGSNEPGTPRDAIAAQIEALRDWTFLRTCHSYHSLEVRDLLTEQARIARGEQ